MIAYAAMLFDSRRLILAFLVAAIVVLAFAPAEGATPDAWTDHQKEVVTACVAASNLRDAKPSGSLIEFDDRVAHTAVLIDGRYPQPHMKNKRGRILCLFDKRARRFCLAGSFDCPEAATVSIRLR